MLTSFDSLLTEATAALSEREAEKNKWLRNDGTPCSNYIWKYASKTKQGDAGEAVVRDALSAILSEIYGTVTVEVVNMGKGDFDVHAIIPAIDRTITFEVKTATEDVSGCHQFNGLKKSIAYDFAFLFGVAPEGFFFTIESHQYLCDTMTTNMSRDVEGSYKHTVKQSKLLPFTPAALLSSLKRNGIA